QRLGLVDGGAGRRRRIGVLGGETAAADGVVGDVVLDEPVEVGAVGDRVVVLVQLVLVRVLPVVGRAPVERHDGDVGDERAVAVAQPAGGAGGARVGGAVGATGAPAVECRESAICARLRNVGATRCGRVSHPTSAVAHETQRRGGV